MQERVALPSMMTVQTLHWPRPQPKRGTVEVQVVSQNVEKRRRGVDVHLVRRAVDAQFDDAHGFPSMRLRVDAGPRLGQCCRGFNAAAYSQYSLHPTDLPWQGSRVPCLRAAQSTDGALVPAAVREPSQRLARRIHGKRNQSTSWVSGTATRMPTRGEMFQVIGIDTEEDTVEVQYFDGDIEELPQGTWHSQGMQVAPRRRGWTGPYDEIARDDLGYSDSEPSRGERRGATENIQGGASDEQWKALAMTATSRGSSIGR